MPLSCVSTKPQKQPGAVADVVTKRQSNRSRIAHRLPGQALCFRVAMAVVSKGVLLDVIGGRGGQP